MATKDDVRDIIKKEVPPITPMIVEVVPGIVAVETKPVREQPRQIETRLDVVDEEYIISTGHEGDRRTPRTGAGD
jgi:hypothetical protein